MSDQPRCPKCGYSAEDCYIHGDHHLCGAPHPEAPGPDAGGLEALDFLERAATDRTRSYSTVDVLVASANLRTALSAPRAATEGQQPVAWEITWPSGAKTLEWTKREGQLESGAPYTARALIYADQPPAAQEEK